MVHFATKRTHSHIHIPPHHNPSLPLTKATPSISAPNKVANNKERAPLCATGVVACPTGKAHTATLCAPQTPAARCQLRQVDSAAPLPNFSGREEIIFCPSSRCRYVRALVLRDKANEDVFTEVTVVELVNFVYQGRVVYTFSIIQTGLYNQYRFLNPYKDEKRRCINYMQK